MMKIEPSILPSLAWFALIVRAGSFSRAASEMGITRAALSQNLKSLEERLNTKTRRYYAAPGPLAQW